MNTQTVQVADIQAGDRVFDADGRLSYTAVRDSMPGPSANFAGEPVACHCAVLYHDGGFGYRDWIHADIELEVERRS